MLIQPWKFPAQVALLPALALIVLAGCQDEPNLLEPLEAVGPSAHSSHALVVTTTAADGPGSLSQAIDDAEAGATIEFDPSLAGENINVPAFLIIKEPLTIEGPTTEGVTILGSGASYVLSIDPGVVATLRNVTISGGRHSVGAGVFNLGTVTLEHTTVTGNEASGSGGGIANHGLLTLINSTVSGNRAAMGGGIANHQGETPPTLILVNSTIAHNTAAEGLGIYSEGGTISFRNSLLVNVGTATAAVFNCSFSNTTTSFVGMNLFHDFSCWDGPTPPDGAEWAAPLVLGELSDNGGPTHTHALLRLSRGIDEGINCSVDVDQRYVPRTQGSGCDVGAYEFDDFTTVTITPDASGSVNPNNGIAIITGSMTCSHPAEVQLDVSLRQVSNSGRVKAIVEASDVTTVSCDGTRHWSIALTPPTGAFRNGAATVVAQTPADLPNYVLPATAERSVKMFWGHK